MIFLDTGAWVALSVPGDRNAKPATALYSEISRGVHEAIVTTSFVLGESATLIRMATDVENASRFLRTVLGAHSVTVVWIDPGHSRGPWTCSNATRTSDGASRTSQASWSCETWESRTPLPSTETSMRPDSLECHEAPGSPRSSGFVRGIMTHPGENEPTELVVDLHQVLTAMRTSEDSA